jgi:hypothetical protein
MTVTRIDGPLVPREVREGGKEERELWHSALAFESLLVRKLAEALTSSTDEDEEGGDAATSSLRSRLPEALADGIAAAGGLGLGPDLYRALRPTGKGAS